MITDLIKFIHAPTAAERLAGEADSHFIRCEDEYPADLLAARRAAFIEQIDAINSDPRNCAERDLDEWQADWRDTNESNRPPQ